MRASSRAWSQRRARLRLASVQDGRRGGGGGEEGGEGKKSGSSMVDEKPIILELKTRLGVKISNLCVLLLELFGVPCCFSPNLNLLLSLLLSPCLPRMSMVRADVR